MVDSNSKKNEVNCHPPRFLEEILNTYSDGILLTTMDHKILMVNSVFCSFFNFSRQEILNTRFLPLLSQLDSGAAERWLEIVKKKYLEGLCRDVTVKINIGEENRYFSVRLAMYAIVGDGNPEEKQQGNLNEPQAKGQKTIEEHFIVSFWKDISNSSERESLYRKLLNMGAELNRTINLSEALTLCVHEAIAVSGMDSGGIYLVNRVTGNLELYYSEGLSQDFIKTSSTFNCNSANALLVRKGEPLYMKYEDVLPKEQHQTRKDEGLRFLSIVPVIHEHRVIACLNIASHYRDEITEAERHALETFAIQIGGFITRLQAEEALRESEERYRTLQDNIPLGIFRTTPEGKIISANPALARMLGCQNVEELLANPAMDYYAVQEQRIELIKQLEEKGVVTDFEVEFKRKDSCTFWGTLNVTGVTGNRGKIIYHDGILENVSERKKWSEAILRAREEWERTFDSVSEEITILDKNYRILRVNKSAADRLGVSPEAAVGLTCYEVMHKTNKPPSYCPHVAMLKDGKEHTVEIHEEQLQSDYRVTVSPLHDARGKMVGAVHACRDVTEEKKMRDELGRTEKLESLGLLAGGIAHDFNNILTSILVNIGLSKNNVHKVEQVLTRLGEAEKAVIRAKDLTKQLLTFSKGGAPIKSQASIEGLLEDTTEFALSGSNVKCKFDIANDLWDVEIDEGQISQVIQNLVMNSMQAMPSGGLLNVRAKNVTIKNEDGLAIEEGKYIKVTVQDQGVGIPREYQKKIFDPFFSTKQKGSGLGLSTAYSIIKNHNGLITLESELGAGTIFRIYLPASGERSERELIEKEILVKGHGKILLMDDEEIILDATSDMLEEIGYSVETVQTGEEVIVSYKTALAAGEPFDVVIMDLIVPGAMGGKETIKFLLEIDATVRCIVTSGYSTDPVVAHYEEYGFAGAISKPYRMEDINGVIQKAMKKKKKVGGG